MRTRRMCSSTIVSSAPSTNFSTCKGWSGHSHGEGALAQALWEAFSRGRCRARSWGHSGWGHRLPNLDLGRGGRGAAVTAAGGGVTISCTPCVPLSKTLLLTTLLCQGGMPSWGGGSTAVGQGSEAMGQREAEGGRADVQLPGCRWRARTAAGTEEQSRTWGAARRLGGPRSGGAAHSAAARSASGVDLAALWAAQSTAGAEHGAPLPSLGPEPSQEAPAPRPHPEGVSRTPLLLG